MRVTDRLTYENARATTAAAREAAQAALQQVSSGTRIHHPGDDPAGVGMMVALGMSSERLGAIAKAATAASGELNAADGAVGDIGNALIRARELAVSLSGSTGGASVRPAAAKEVAGLVSRIVAALNTKSGNRYLFGGSADQGPAFDDHGDYLGDDGERQVEVAPGVYQTASVRADVMMGTTGTGTNVVATLQALQAALQADDGAGVGAALGGLDASLAQVGVARAELGVNLDTIDTAATLAKNGAADTQAQATQLGAVDLADASIQMQATQSALQATLTAAARSFKVSLLDYLG